MSATQGLSGAARRVADHARSLVQLEVQLALAEIKRKAVALGAGIGLLLGGALVALLATVLAVAAATAAIATVLAVWAALLIMFGGLLLLAGVLGVVGVSLLRKGTPPVPEQAIQEARITTEALRNGR
jgi:Putative Actinobacterial Holin-X, holin superfamily III